MSRLPTPGGDDGSWGAVLNDYLSVALNTDGTLKRDADITTALTKATAAPTALTGLSDVNASGPADTQVLTYNASTSKWIAATVTSSVITDASSGSKGIIQLAGDIAGTATVPVVAAGAITDAKISASAAIAQSKISGLTVGLAAKATDAAVVHNSGTESVAGAKTFSTSISTPALQVTGGTPGTGKVLTSDGSGNVSWQTAASAPVSSVAGRTGAVTLSNADVTGLGTAATISATAGGDLTGTLPSPTVAKINGTSVPATPTAGQVLTATSGTAASWQTPAGGGSSLTIKDEGTTLTAAPTSLNFVGAGVTATTSTGAVTVTIPGGGGGSSFPSWTIVRQTGSLANPTYTANAGEWVIIDASTRGMTITLPAAAANATVLVKKTDATSNAVAVQGPGATMVDPGLGAYTLNGAGAAGQYLSDGTNWYAISNY